MFRFRPKPLKVEWVSLAGMLVCAIYILYRVATFPWARAIRGIVDVYLR